MFGRKKFKKISHKSAMKAIKKDPGICVIDVRKPTEFNFGHIPGAICIPEDLIGKEPILKLPGKDETVLLYCRTGRRAKKAAKKLVRMGYKDVRVMGGIISWRGPVTRN